LADAIAKHAAHLHSSGGWAGREQLRLAAHVESMLRDSLVSEFHRNVPSEKYEGLLQQVYKHDLSPWAAVKKLMNGRQP